MKAFSSDDAAGAILLRRTSMRGSPFCDAFSLEGGGCALASLVGVVVLNEEGQERESILHSDVLEVNRGGEAEVVEVVFKDTRASVILEFTSVERAKAFVELLRVKL